MPSYCPLPLYQQTFVVKSVSNVKQKSSGNWPGQILLERFGTPWRFPHRCERQRRGERNSIQERWTAIGKKCRLRRPTMERLTVRTLRERYPVWQPILFLLGNVSAGGERPAFVGAHDIQHRHLSEILLFLGGLYKNTAPDCPTRQENRAVVGKYLTRCGAAQCLNVLFC
jgi:hypothetical protein